jgi:hypothetical protein
MDSYVKTSRAGRLRGIVAARSRQRGREYFWKSLTPEGGMLLKISSARGPYLLETDIRLVARPAWS